MKALWNLALFGVALSLCLPAAAQQANYPPGVADGPMTENPQVNKAAQAKQKSNTPASSDNASEPSDNESSSNSTKIDLRPPMGDLKAHPNGGRVGDEALAGQHEWNPMRAMKDIEVGDFYYRDGNYRGAIARYRDALEFKPRDADATLKLARTLEKTKEYQEARMRYQQYLEILKDGPGAAEAKKALERLKPVETANSPK